MEKGIEIGVEKGMEKGIEIGVEKGMEKGKLEEKTAGIVKAIKQNKLPLEDIAEIFDVTLEFVLEINKNN
jgi:flagellar biosynthesis/type III secretory pathway protein FliH